MSYAPLAARTLCLFYQFELSPASSTVHRDLPHMDHDAAAKKAAALSGLCAPSEVAARCRIIDEPVDIASVHAFPPGSWRPDAPDAVLLDVVYAADGTAMCARILTDIARFDGVTASRILFHTLEVLEGQAVNSARFKANPPFRYCWRHLANVSWLLTRTLADVGWGIVKYRTRFFWSKATDKTLCSSSEGVPFSAYDLMVFYSCREYDRSVHRVYAADTETYEELIEFLEKWKNLLGKDGFFYLLNFSPKVAPGMTKHAWDLKSIEARYRGVTHWPGSPPSGRIWKLLQYPASRKIFFNNYGRHENNFSIKPVGFGWDWIDLAGTINGCGVITINGHFLCWLRGLRRTLDQHRDLIEGILGDPVTEFVQAAPLQ